MELLYCIGWDCLFFESIQFNHPDLDPLSLTLWKSIFAAPMRESETIVPYYSTAHVAMKHSHAELWLIFKNRLTRL